MQEVHADSVKYEQLVLQWQFSASAQKHFASMHRSITPPASKHKIFVYFFDIFNFYIIL